jgi:hypothetical protein
MHVARFSVVDVFRTCTFSAFRKETKMNKQMIIK